MKPVVVFFCLLVVTCCKLHAQSCPPNLDFEAGTFAHWECFIGSTYVNDKNENVIEDTLSGPLPDRHEIISANSAVKKDPYGGFPTMCPYGGKYSVKLGNDISGAEAEGLSYTFVVPSDVDTFTFTYFYAVVFEDPSHQLYEQPRFFVTAYEVETGAVINCASYNYVSHGAIPGFQKSKVNDLVLYKSWSPTSLQFAGLKNKKVRLEFKTADCALGGHFGYAYVDVASACSNILATAPYCRETNSLILNAPYGFETYNWYNDGFKNIIGHGQSLTLSPPPDTVGEYHVDVIPYPGYGCRDTLQASIKPLPVPGLPVAGPNIYCQFAPTHALDVTSPDGNEIWWYTSDTGGVGTTEPFLPSTQSVGAIDYYVTQKVLFGCESFRSKVTATVLATPQIAFNINQARQCENGNEFVFTNTTSNLYNSTFQWDFGNSIASTVTDSVIHYSYDTSGNFNITLKVTNAGTCSTQVTHNVTVIPKPQAAFNFPQIICENQTLVTLSDRSSVGGYLASLSSWWWQIDNNVSTKQNPDAFVATSLDSVHIAFAAQTSEGCNSDTIIAVLDVHPKPRVQFSLTSHLCENEVINFADASVIDAGNPNDAVSTWSWNFDNTAVASSQYDARFLPAGLHHVQLISGTNFGCLSSPLDSLIMVNAKPQMLVTINDSCINRLIYYTASDVLGNVDKWYWNLGSGLHEDAPLIKKAFYTEGSRPFMLLAVTVDGCRDSIYRPFTIYDNKAFAGRDTIAAMDEPVQLNAHGGTHNTYTWTPAVGLNDATLENPVATLDRDQLYKLDALTDKGCDAHSQILIKRYKGPELYIPSAFTPNADGLNDVLKVFPVGIKTFTQFSIYNRYGQKVFQTYDYSKGWDGTVNGTRADSGAYVAIATAIDYRNRPMMNKITVVLLR